MGLKMATGCEITGDQCRLCVSPLQDLFAKTQGDKLLMYMRVSWHLMKVPNCGAITCCSWGCDVGVTCGMLRV